MRSLLTRRLSALLATLSLPAALSVAVSTPAFAADAPAAANLPAISETGDKPKPDHWPMKWDLGLGVGYNVISSNTGLGNSANQSAHNTKQNHPAYPHSLAHSILP